VGPEKSGGVSHLFGEVRRGTQKKKNKNLRASTKGASLIEDGRKRFRTPDQQICSSVRVPSWAQVGRRAGPQFRVTINWVTGNIPKDATSGDRIKGLKG